MAEARQTANTHGQAPATLAAQLQQLSARLDLSTPPPAPAPAPPPATPADGPEPRVGSLERFAGDPRTCGAFITNCSLLFSLQSCTFTTEARIVLHLGPSKNRDIA